MAENKTALACNATFSNIPRLKPQYLSRQVEWGNWACDVKDHGTFLWKFLDVSCWYKSIHHLGNHSAFFIIHMFKQKTHQTATQPHNQTFFFRAALGCFELLQSPWLSQFLHGPTPDRWCRIQQLNPKGSDLTRWSSGGAFEKSTHGNHHGLPPKKKEVWILDDENLPEISWRMFF